MWAEHQDVKLSIEWEREDDGRWIADIPELPGVMAYGESLPDALVKVTGLAVTRVLDLREQGVRVGEVTFALVPGVAA